MRPRLSLYRVGVGSPDRVRDFNAEDHLLIPIPGASEPLLVLCLVVLRDVWPARFDQTPSVIKTNGLTKSFHLCLTLMA